MGRKKGRKERKDRGRERRKEGRKEKRGREEGEEEEERTVCQGLLRELICRAGSVSSIPRGLQGKLANFIRGA